jgi:hypothetical protein
MMFNKTLGQHLGQHFTLPNLNVGQLGTLWDKIWDMSQMPGDNMGTTWDNLGQQPLENTMSN